MHITKKSYLCSMEYAEDKRGDSINLKQINVFQHYYLTMYSELKYFVCKYVDTEEEGVDLIQDVWLKLWELQLSFPNEAALKTYLYRMAHNAAISLQRTQQKFQDITEYTEDIAEGDDRTILNAMIESEIHSMISEAFSELSPSCRRVYLENLKGKSQKEISEKLNISINTVKKHINNANHYLRKRLEHLYMLISLFRC